MRTLCIILSGRLVETSYLKKKSLPSRKHLGKLHKHLIRLPENRVFFFCLDRPFPTPQTSIFIPTSYNEYEKGLEHKKFENSLNYSETRLWSNFSKNLDFHSIISNGILMIPNFSKICLKLYVSHVCHKNRSKIIFTLEVTS